MRYKVKADTDESFRDLHSFLSGKVKLFVASPRRRLLATEDLSDEMRREIASRGGQVAEDRQYDLE